MYCQSTNILPRTGWQSVGGKLFLDQMTNTPSMLFLIRVYTFLLLSRQRGAVEHVDQVVHSWLQVCTEQTWSISTNQRKTNT